MTRTIPYQGTCFPCYHYRMQGCMIRGSGHPRIGNACKTYQAVNLVPSLRTTKPNYPKDTH